MILIHEFEEITNGTFLNKQRNDLIINLFTDSRKNFQGRASLFIALKTDRNDGHKYITDLYEKGCRNFIVTDSVSIAHLGEANILKVDNAISALQSIGRYKRERFSGKLVGITGSNGKTTVKEWLYQLLAPHYYCVKSPGSFNSQIGVPLSLWNLNPNHEIALIEAGISEPGEMDRLENIIQPDIGIFTNLGSSHDEGFSSSEEKLQEKLKLFKGCKQIICAEKWVEKIQKYQSAKTLSWGKGQNNFLRIENQILKDHGVRLELIHNKFPFTIELPFSDEAFLENILNCICTLITLGIAPRKIQQGISGLKPVKMRMSIRKGIRGNSIIDDTYNNDWVGLTHAMNYLHQQAAGRNKVVILSDILQTGLPNKELYARVSKLLLSEHINQVIAVGKNSSRGLSLVENVPLTTFETTEELLQSDTLNLLENSCILIKGARQFRFERLVKKLEEKSHSTHLEINFTNLLHNLSYYRSKLKPGVKLMAMVKALSYGGGNEIPFLLQHVGVDYLGVAYPDEGVELRKAGVEVPIMVMNSYEGNLEDIFKYRLEPEIYSIELLIEFLSISAGRKAKIHLKLETGMNRLGFSPQDFEKLQSILIEAPHIQIASIFSHLVGSEDESQDDFTHEQARRFYSMATELKRKLKIQDAFLHILNSAGIARFPQYHFHLVRLGLGLHGISSNPDEQQILRPVETFRSYITQVHNVKKGETVGYNRRGVLHEDRKIATIAVGYADGYRRQLGNRVGKVLVKGKMAEVVGNVCMDMCMIDVTDIDVTAGDEVVLFGPGYPISEFADQLNTIPYEVLTSISSRVKRVYIYE